MTRLMVMVAGSRARGSFAVVIWIVAGNSSGFRLQAEDATAQVRSHDMRNRMALTGVLALALAGTGVRLAAEDGRAVEVMTAARKAIGDKKLDGVKTLTVEAQVQRNMGAMQMTTETEILLELPDRYLRSDTASGPMSGGMTSGFNGDKVIRPANTNMAMAGGGMMIRMGPGAPQPGEKVSPEEQERLDKLVLRNSRIELSRLMLGWFAAAHPSIGAAFTYAGEAESPDGKADVIDVKNADGFNARLFIDRETHLPLMITYQGPQPRIVTAGGPMRQAAQPPSGGHAVQQTAARREMTEEERKTGREEAERQIEAMRNQPQTMVEYSLYFDDWREVGGIKFPHRLRRAMSGTTNEEWTINKVRVNSKIDPKKFEG
jgi:hypothetical protein